MALLPIRTYGDPFLKKKAADIKEVSAVQALIDDMFETMYENKGVGLAAVQVGKGINLFVINAAWEKEDKTSKGIEEVFINPRITGLHGKNCEMEEGCLSVPEIRENVRRKEFVDIEYTDRHGKRRAETGIDGMRSRVIQHEFDHLHGILFVDRLPPAKRIFMKKELRRLAEEIS
jgi:peptide deformylase